MDTNVVIPAEGEEEVDSGLPLVAEFISRAHDHRHRVAVHPANRDDLLEAELSAARDAKIAKLGKYPMLAESPIPAEMLGDGVVEGSNDHRDLRLIAAVVSGAATYLVTEDKRLRSRAARLGVGSSVLGLRDTIDLLERLHPSDATPPPSVDLIPSYLVDVGQPIFDSLRADYEGFDDWFKTKVATDDRGRRCWVVIDPDGEYDAIAIVKMVDEHPERSADVATKLATFKVSEHRAGEKVGELLLRTVLEWANGQRVADLFVEVDPSKTSLIRFFEQFGFVLSTALARERGDVTYLKTLRPRDPSLNGLDYHIRFGPPAVREPSDIFVVPIVPKWYDGLFPDSPTVGGHGQVSLGGVIDRTSPFGNAIRKAYLCHSPTQFLPPGAALLFYRSGAGRGSGFVQAIGVVERSVRTADPERVLSFVGRRTVYSAADVVGLCEGGSKPVLATLFRHDHYVGSPISLKELREQNVLRGAPQSITRVKNQEGIQWLTPKLNESP
jgi:GNAT superfamily N-acetyltransferase